MWPAGRRAAGEHAPRGLAPARGLSAGREGGGRPQPGGSGAHGRHAKSAVAPEAPGRRNSIAVMTELSVQRAGGEARPPGLRQVPLRAGNLRGERDGGEGKVRLDPPRGGKGGTRGSGTRSRGWPLFGARCARWEARHPFRGADLGTERVRFAGLDRGWARGARVSPGLHGRSAAGSAHASRWSRCPGAALAQVPPGAPPAEKVPAHWDLGIRTRTGRGNHPGNQAYAPSLLQCPCCFCFVLNCILESHWEFRLCGTPFRRRRIVGAGANGWCCRPSRILRSSGQCCLHPSSGHTNLLWRFVLYVARCLHKGQLGKVVEMSGHQ